MIPKFRLDALTDGVFAVAMTLLVIDLRLPDGFQPRDASELLQRLVGMHSQIIVYAISFYVLGMRWVGVARLSPQGEEAGEHYTRWALILLFLITLVPFSTMIVARYSAMPPAVWAYCGNILLISLVSLRLIALKEDKSNHDREARLGLALVVVSSSLAIAASFIFPRGAMLFFLINLADGPFRRIFRQRSVQPRPEQ